MINRDLRPGDKVKCIDVQSTLLDTDKCYTVVRYDNEDTVIVMDEHGIESGGWYDHRFEKILPPLSTWQIVRKLTKALFAILTSLRLRRRIA